MRKIPTLRLALTLLICTVGCTRFKEARQAAHFSVLDSDTACGETSGHTLQIDLIGNKSAQRAIVRLNGTNSSWEAIGPTLHDLFSVRTEKFVYVTSDPAVSESDYSAMSLVIEKAGAERLCLIGFTAPRKYVPLIVGGSQ
jgi:hypothetical protein